ncbi:MAG TPA: amidohydrolase family protein [Trebonia sp.]|nr:amidohydrolase family protein [Trebonia sp.]
MIIDVHTHTPTHRDVVPEDEVSYSSVANNLGPVKMTNTWADYDAGTAAADITIVFNIQGRDGLRTQPVTLVDRLNEDTADFAAADPARRIGFMSLNPNFSGYLDEFEACLELGLRGIKLGANYQQFDPLGAPARELYRRAQDRGLPILFHQGTSPVRFAPLRYAHPLVTDEIAMDFPDLRIVMAHMGHPWTRETVVTIRKHPNVYADISAMCVRPMMAYEALTQATEWGVLDKLLFGSDFPVITSARTIQALRGVNDPVAGTGLPKISLEAIERIIHADALTALGLSVPSPAN